MESSIASDPRFAHILTDPKFKTVPRRARKVRIGSRFHSMFTDDKFKINYGVDKRGRRVQESSAEDMRRYYCLHDDDKNDADSPKSRQKKLKKRLKVVAGSDASEVGVASREYDIGEDHTHEELKSDEESVLSESRGVESGAESDSSTDVEDVMTLREPEIVHGWWDEEVSPSHSVESGSRLALCRMDWDRVNATDIFVFLSSFKPQGGSILSVSVFPSDFGQERMGREELQGPAELLDQSDCSTAEGACLEGQGFSNERLRHYQLQRLNYYYAVIECDSKGTAEHVYEECDGLQYEHCGGKLDLRFIPDDMTFDKCRSTSVATETSIPAGYTPPDFVTSALQQSKVRLTWDETDPLRLQTTMRKFSRDDVLKMDFDAYLASSSGESGSESGTPGVGGEEPNSDHSGTKLSRKAARYRSLLDSEDGECGGEVLEVTWEPGLRGEVSERVRVCEGEGGTTWDQYQRERKSKKKKLKSGDHDDQKVTEVANDLGFDDPFFNDEVAMETKKKRKRSKDRVEGEGARQEKSELELLMMEGESEREKDHFSLESILHSEKRKSGKTRRKRKDGPSQPVEDSFEVNVSDPRFGALYSCHDYAPDPTHPQFRATKAMSAIMGERRRQRKRGGASAPQATPTNETNLTSDL